ncbi:SEC-C metal-binding domain-containing protein [Pseudonocardia hispaniensis]|uniref:SEC-C metal-binding domain-containing protein n=1 Tax=Pseudonocardia hispaniensis TaxID=904933 RepID=A0ABW1IYU4_9PSEU
MRAADTDLATQLEAEAQEYPDERGELLLEAAQAWVRAGDRERATRLLGDLIDAGGADGCYARVEMAELLWEDDRGAEAENHLAALARDPALHDGHCQLAAELLAERRDLKGALRWYDRLVARLPSDEIEAVRGPDGWAAFASIPLRGRREVRRELGLASDAMDEIVPTAPFERPPDLDDLRAHLDAGRTPPRELRVLTFQRAERAEARRRWPDEYSDVDEDYYPAVELRWREMAERGVPTIRVALGTVAGLVAFAEATGGSPTESTLRAEYAAAVPAEQTVAWPPPRNSACWCGSGMKYKKCCGAVR